jgi:PPOX class probable F420-dependent enzyme
VIEVPPQILERLAKEQVIWLTTAKADGTPLPNPVWFLWNGEQFLIFTEADSVKMKNMTRNARVALNLNSDSDGGNIAIFQAEAEIKPAPINEEELNAYVSKYSEGMQRIGLSTGVLIADYHLIRIVPTKFRTVS